MKHVGKQWLMAVALLLVGQFALAGNPFWWLIDFNPLGGIQDKKLMKAILRLNKTDVRSVEHYFKKHDKDTARENLGFGWTVWKAGVSSWDIAISATFYYNRDSLVSYSLHPNYSAQKGKLKRQQKRLRSVFQVLNDTAQPYVFNQSSLFVPLENYPGGSQHIPPAIGRYMSPLSGTVYGYYWGGLYAELLPNRLAFKAIENSLRNSDVERLMYAINPATRFTAFEFYLGHKERFGERPDIDAWMEQNIAAFPTLPIRAGCSVYEEDTRYLLWQFSLRYSLPQKE